jgi:DNA-binding CsgD family transcriptional regulator
MPQRTYPALVGRIVERRTLDDLLETVRGGRSAVLVIRGEPGVGKTTLLDCAEEMATEFHVRRIVGVESEMELPFAALQQLCAPMLDRLDELAEPQQDALGVAFGLAQGAAPDRFSVALAVLSLVAEVAAEQPLLCLVDDAQWLDAASAQVLGFVARRLVAEPAAMLFAARDGQVAGELGKLPELVVEGLPPDDARALLANAAPRLLNDRLQERLIAETRGNPLALVELARVPSTAFSVDAESSATHSAQLPVAIEGSFLERLRGIDDDVRRLLLIAAAEPTGDPVLLWRAARRLGVPRIEVPPEAEGLLTIGARVTFRHPLVRSAVYRAASPEERRAVHVALVHATDEQRDEGRRAWHLAAAAHGLDDEAATELERSAARAQRRGGFAAAAALLQRSVALTSEAARRSDRALAAARASLHAGAFDDAREALVTAEAGTHDALDAAHIELVRGQIDFAAGSVAKATGRLRAAATKLERLDPALARETHLHACGAALFCGPAGAPDLIDIARAVRALPRPTGRPRAVDDLLDGLALLITEGRASAARTLLPAVRAFADASTPVDESLRWGWMATAGSNALWDDQGLYEVCRRNIRLARQSGALEYLPLYLIAYATTTARAGDARSASSLIAEADVVAQMTGTRLVPFAAELHLASLHGNEAEFLPLSAAATQGAHGAPDQGVMVAELSTAILLNGLSRYEDALDAASRVSSVPGDLYASMWALPEIVEAASRTGKSKRAREALARLVESTRAAGTEYGLGMEARSRALLADGDEAERLHREAIDRLARTHMRSDLARAHLLYGEWLRRAGRRSDGRDQLRTAHALFTAMDMTAFADRARRELDVSGTTLRPPVAASRDALTPQEAQIAALAADGLTNAEIAARLFLSPRTVEWHLKHVFAKLGITSRRALPDALADGPGP